VLDACWTTSRLGSRSTQYTARLRRFTSFALNACWARFARVERPGETKHVPQGVPACPTLRPLTRRRVSIKHVCATVRHPVVAVDQQASRPLADRDQVSYDWQHYLPLIERKPGALRNARPLLICRRRCVSLSTVWGVMPAVTGSWRKFWLPYRSPGSMRCWWLLSWYWKAAA
jgi:hypothetical protein